MDYFSYRDGEYCAEDVPLRAIAAEVGTPFYCYSTATLLRHYTQFAKALAAYKPRICFAVKSNGNLAVLKTLASAGAGADVVSEGELRLALKAGIPAAHCVFSGVAKTAAEMRFALQQGIFQLNAESAAELETLNAVAGEMGLCAPVALRVNPDVEAGTHAKISTGQKENKFGIAMEQAREIYRQAASLPHLDVQGVSIHIGSQLTSLEPFRQAFKRVRQLVEQLRADGHNIRTLDLGGGLGIPYEEGAAPPSPQDYAAVVDETMRGFDGQLMFEPGRMIAGNAGVLVTTVLYVKQTEHKRFLMVDAGMNDLMRPALYDAYHAILPVREGQGGVQPYDVVGPVCESSCIFAKNRALPESQAGDLLVLRSAGAYGASMSNSYNARLLVPEVLVKGNEFAVVRKRPDYEALFALQQLPQWEKTDG